MHAPPTHITWGGIKRREVLRTLREYPGKYPSESLPHFETEVLWLASMHNQASWAVVDHHCITASMMFRRRKQFHFGGAERNIHCDAAIWTACMNINKVSRVKYWGGGGGGGGPWPPAFPPPRVANVKNQPPNFKQLIPCAWRAHWCLNNRTLKLHSQAYIASELHRNCFTWLRG